MAITNDQDEKCTANQLAKEMIMDAMSRQRAYWTESMELQYEKMTELEVEKVETQLQRQADRVAKFLGYKQSWCG